MSVNVNDILNHGSPAQEQPGADPVGGQDPTMKQQGQGSDFDHKFALLAKKERMMREKENSWTQREKEWEEKSRKLAELEELSKLMEENPLEAIKRKKGWDLQQLNEHAVKTMGDDELDPVAQITRNFQKQMEEMKTNLTQEFQQKIQEKEQEYTKKDYDHQISNFKSSIKDFVTENKGEYEFINAYRDQDGKPAGIDLVYEVIYADVIRRKEGGEEELAPMSFKDACNKVETYLDSQLTPLLNLNKVRSKFSSDSVDLDKLVTQNSPKTINNSFVPKTQSLDQLSAADRRKQAEDLVRSWLR
jgi:hypothetical protein